MRGNSLGASMAAVSAGAVGSTTLLNPASNTKGAWLRGGVVVSNTTASGALFADTAAPTAVSDITKRQIAGSWQGTGSASQGVVLVPPTWLPPGVGLFFFASAAVPYCNVNWDLVS